MENFFYNENYYSNIQKLSDYLFDSEEEIVNLLEDYKIEVNCSDLQYICQFEHNRNKLSSHSSSSKYNGPSR